MRFDGFFGNQQAKTFLSAAFGSGRVPHAFLIEGPSGSGKKTLAKLIAQAAVCKPQDINAEKPCGKCLNCHKALNGCHPDIVLYSPAAGARSFSVDLVRKIRSEAYICPNEAEYKVYILPEAQNMTEQAQNALLKTLEEPPSSTIFILTCDDKSKMLGTVLSRCSVLSLSALSEDDAAYALQALMPGIDGSSALKAAKTSGGNIGNAKALLDAGATCLEAIPAGFSDALCGTDKYGFIKISGSFEKNASALGSFLEVLPLVFRDAAAIKLKSAQTLSGCYGEAKKLAARFTLRQLYLLAETSISAREALDRYVNATLLLTWLFNRLWLIVHT